MARIKCKNKECGVSIDFNNSLPEDQLDWRLGADNKTVIWTCMECDEEWEGGFAG